MRGGMASARLRQRLMQGAIDKIVDQARFPEPHFVFGRMHVDIDAARIQFEEQHVRGMAAMEQHVRKRLAHRMGHVAVAHAAAVDVQVLLVGAGAVVARLGDPAMQAQARAAVVHPQRVAGELLTQRFMQPDFIEQVAVALPAPRRLAVVGYPQLHIGPCQRQRTQPFLDVGQLGALCAQEFASRRNVVEQVAHFHRSARRMRLRRHLADAAAIDLEHRAVCGMLAARGQREAAHRRH